MQHVLLMVQETQLWLSLTVADTLLAVHYLGLQRGSGQAQ